MEQDCIFCKIIKGELPSTKIYENDYVFAFLDIKPVNIGHTLVIPKKHFKNIYETPEETMSEIIKVAKKVSEAVKKTGVGGVNIAMNNDKAGGQVIFHSHVHVIPRYEGDGFGLWHGKRDYEEGEMQKVATQISQAM